MVESGTMKTQPKPRLVSESEWTWTIFSLAVGLGVFVRILPLLMTDFPINDGGMFYVMIRDLNANGLALPVITTYNALDIPFAYPPLGLYLGAVLVRVGLAETTILRWVPTLFSAATILLFFLLARELMGDRPRAALATALFALTPGDYAWLLMGGGLTRALGAVSYLAAIAHAHRTLVSPTWRSTLLATLFCSLVVLSHPQYAFLAVMGCAIFCMFHVRSRNQLFHASLIVAGTLLLTSPWWGLVILRHGLEVFTSAGQSGDFGIFLSDLWKNLVQRQTIIPLLTIFRWLGLGWVIVKGRSDLVVWGFLPYLVDQRSAPIVSMFMFPILAAYGFLDVLPALVNWLRTREWQIPKDAALFNLRPLSMGLLGILFYLFIECCAYAYVIRNMVLPDQAREVMAWARKNTAADGNFLILTGRKDVMTDPMQEWFPALADRQSITTIQGLEWTLEDGFRVRYAGLYGLQSCSDLDCVRSRADRLDAPFSYLIVDERNSVITDSLPNHGYHIVFENSRYKVFEE